MSWFGWLAVVLSGVELDGVWLEGLLDAYITLIHKADGDATPLGQRPLCVLTDVYAFGRLLGCGIGMIGSSLGFLLLWLALGVVVGLWRPGTPLLWTLRRFSLA